MNRKFKKQILAGKLVDGKLTFEVVRTEDVDLDEYFASDKFIEDYIELGFQRYFIRKSKEVDPSVLHRVFA